MTFEMISGVKVFGGFLGDEPGGNEDDRADRDVINNPPAILSGEISDDNYNVDISEVEVFDCGEAASDCFGNNGTSGCDDAACCEFICGVKGFDICCQPDDGWDDLCAQLAVELGCCLTTPDLMDNSHYVVTATGVDTSARLGGVTVTAGSASDGTTCNGGGIHINDGGDLVVTNCTIIENCAFDNGGGVYVRGIGSDPGNPADPLFYNNLFIDNEVQGEGFGGAAAFTGASNPDIINSLFVANFTGDPVLPPPISQPDPTPDSDGGAIFTAAGGPNGSVTLNLVNNTFSRNSEVDDGTMLLHDEGTVLHNDSTNNIIDVTNSILWNNGPVPGNQITGGLASVTVMYTDIEGGGFGGKSNNNLDVDPEFVNPAAGNFRLDPAISPVIDVGDSLTIMAFDDIFDVDDDGNDTEPVPDLDLETRIIDRLVDLGAYEVADGGTPCPGDINDDGLVDGADLGLLLGAFGTDPPNPPEADIDGDGMVDGADLGLLLGAFGSCTELPVPPDLSEYGISQSCLNLYEDLIRYGTTAEQDNARCWLEHYLSCHCDQGICHCPPNSCSGADPCNGH